MKVICDGLDLSEAVMKVIKASSNKALNPILEGIKITAEDESLTLVCTDSELVIEKKIKADVIDEGEIVVPGKFFSEYVKKLANEKIELELLENNRLKLKYTDSEMFVQCLNAIEFPVVAKIDNAQYFTLKESDLKDIIDKTIFAVATDNTRPILKGCLFNIDEKVLTSVALDGYRLAKASKPILEQSAKVSVIIPGRSLNEISKLLDDNDDTIRVFLQRNYLMVQVDSTKIITRLLDGDFINYNQIIPTEFATSLIINKAQLDDTLERAAIISSQNNDYSVNFNIKDNLMTISAKSEIGNLTENLTVALTGNDLNISFDGRFLRDCTKATKDEFLKICFNSPISPCVIKPNTTEDYLFLILPLKQLRA